MNAMATICAVVLAIGLPAAAFGQSDADRLRAHLAGEPPPVLYPGHARRPVQAESVLEWPLKALFYAYQQEITYQMPTNCMYAPSCSEFSRQCLQHYGFMKGMGLTVNRLSRCNRFYVLRNATRMHLHHDHFVDKPEDYAF